MKEDDEDERDDAFEGSKEKGVGLGVRVLSAVVTEALADASKANCAVLET